MSVAESTDIWAHENLIAWCVVPFDAKARRPAERAQMFRNLGFRGYASDLKTNDPAAIDSEIQALKRHGIKLHAWWFPIEPDDPCARAALDVFKRHEVKPQLWVTYSTPSLPKTPQELLNWLPSRYVIPALGDGQEISDEHKAAIHQAMSRIYEASLTKTPEEQEQRVSQEADRIKAMVKLAMPYGCTVQLYNHNGWFGMVDNQLAIIGRLEEIGVTGVGIVYNFSHARDELHDDTTEFPSLWKRIQPHVAAVNVSGTHWEGSIIYPSQGDRELEMMRIIQESGWTGPVGLIAEQGGDAEVTLANCRTGLDWLASEIVQPGAAGPRPFPPVYPHIRP